ncbi:hypothetical protein C9374_005798 [Naegleria lovaniensis]|uniref:Ubiquitin-like domain-containing protein n=1 Tax=Naegleria lovaniensis TaxID=51637 RepID=A0AA88GJ78_NAELO|nr:uncharacterized protein C9374_005798 [Naegleria lovaniensis]KAG2382006.1 hypothetical protein C9374_005798 [Naegleria lovaniensis]
MSTEANNTVTATNNASLEEPSPPTSTNNAQKDLAESQSDTKDTSEQNKDNQDQHILIHVEDQHERKLTFKIKRSARLKKIMELYRQKYGLSSSARFLYDGERIGENDTAISLNIQNNDMINVTVEQTGGYLDFMDIDMN